MGFCMCLHCIQPTPLHNSLFIPITLFAFSPVLKELFNLRHILTAEECSEVAGYEWQWKDHLVLVLAIKPVEAVEEATKVMKLYDLNTQRLHGELMHQCIYMYIHTYGTCHKLVTEFRRFAVLVFLEIPRSSLWISVNLPQNHRRLYTETLLGICGTSVRTCGMIR